MYFCGLKGMMPGILRMLEGVAERKKLVWEDFLKDLKHKGKSHHFSKNMIWIASQDSVKIPKLETCVLAFDFCK